MEQGSLLPEKTFQYLLHLFDTNTTYDVRELLTHSKVYINNNYGSSPDRGVALLIVVDPETYKKYQDILKTFISDIASNLAQFTDTPISKVQVYPDLE